MLWESKVQHAKVCIESFRKLKKLLRQQTVWMDCHWNCLIHFAVALNALKNKKSNAFETASYDDDLNSLTEEVQNAAHAILDPIWILGMISHQRNEAGHARPAS